MRVRGFMLIYYLTTGMVADVLILSRVTYHLSRYESRSVAGMANLDGIFVVFCW